MKKLLIGAVLLLTAAGTTMPTLAQADTGVDQSLRTAVARTVDGSYTPADLALIRQHPEVAAHVVDPTVAPEVSVSAEPVNALSISAKAAAKCKSVDVWYRLKSLLGFTLYKWHQNVSFCYTSTKVTKWTDRYDYVTDKDPTWQLGALKVNEKSKAGGGSAWSHMQREMKQCLPKVGCIDHRLPWSKITVKKKGDYSYTGANQ